MGKSENYLSLCSDKLTSKMRTILVIFCVILSSISLEARQKAGRKRNVLDIKLFASFVLAAGCDDGIIRGVNLGGWLLLEPWITPIFFEAVNVGELQDKVVDEWTYAELLDPVVYKNRMLGHWSTFVTKSHMEELVAAGISHVR